MARSKTQLRIISGTFGGRLIDAPKTSATQPMGDRERNAIFNQIRIGIEALSNGAASVDFLENNPEAARTIRKNLEKLNPVQPTRVIKTTTKAYDLIFADPPYDKPQYGLVEKLAQQLKVGGILILSHPSEPQPPMFRELSLVSDRKYAAANIKIYYKN